MVSDEDHSPPGDRVPISIATWNIQSGRNARLESALRALNKMDVDLAILTEAKLTNGIHTKYSSVYNVVASNAVSHRQGGVALVFKDSPHWQVESTRCFGPNVISAEIVTGPRRIPLVGAYIPPDDTTTLAHVEQALNPFRGRNDLVMLGDLNVPLDAPVGVRDTAIANAVALAGLHDMHHHFRQGRLGGSTWHQIREGDLVRSRPDYVLSRDRRLFTKVAIRRPRHFDSDHRLIRATLTSNPLGENKAYLRGRRKFPRRTPKWGPSTELDSLFQAIEDSVPRGGRQRSGPRRAWISENSWKLVDARSCLRHSLTYTQAEYRRLGRLLKASLKEDRRQRCAKAGAAALAAYEVGEAQEAWRIVAAWYRDAAGRPPKPARQALQQVSRKEIDSK